MQNGSVAFQTASAADERPSLWHRFQGCFHMRPPDDDEPQSWWIASTAIPLAAAAAGPLANVMSIVALVMPWRSEIISYKEGPAGDAIQRGYPDPHWVTASNAISVVCGVVGNVFLLFNFTQSIRYIIALPVSIILWFLATGILVGLTTAVSVYAAPLGPNDVYSQAYWSAVVAACLYFILAIILMINMLGYFLGRYPQHFALTDDQRTLILQMTALVLWLLIGAAIFQRVLGISFADALYFCDITVLTLGFGDIVATTTVERGLVWPYAVVGVITLGLVVSSIHRFASEVHYDNVIRKHIEHKRQSTVERSVTFSAIEAADRDPNVHLKDVLPPALMREGSDTSSHRSQGVPIRDTIRSLATGRRPKLLVMREEKDRFDAMRAIQYETMRFRRWSDLLLSIIVFAIVWTCGAVVFWCLEDDLTYFGSLYFCFCSLLTIGYGDITPKSNAGRPFFVVWSLIAIPTMTILISKMSDTVVASFKRGTEIIGYWLVLPQLGQYKSIFGHFPCILRYMEKQEEKKRVKRGFEVGAGADTAEDEEAEVGNRPTSTRERRGSSQSNARTRSQHAPNHPHRTIEELARAKPSSSELAQQLAFAIRRTTKDAIGGERKRYNYEEWVEFTRLIQFTDPRIRPLSSSSAESRQIPGSDGGPIDQEEDEFGVVNWDWIGVHSPMLAKQTEPEWVLDRLCESLVRYVSTQETRRAARRGQDAYEPEEPTLKKESDLGLIEEDT